MLYSQTCIFILPKKYQKEGNHHGKTKKESIELQQLCKAWNEQDEENVQEEDIPIQVHRRMYQGQVQESHQGLLQAQKRLLSTLSLYCLLNVNITGGNHHGKTQLVYPLHEEEAQGKEVQQGCFPQGCQIMQAQVISHS